MLCQLLWPFGYNVLCSNIVLVCCDVVCVVLCGDIELMCCDVLCIVLCSDIDLVVTGLVKPSYLTGGFDKEEKRMVLSALERIAKQLRK